MTSPEKRLAAIRRNPRQISFEDLVAAMEHEGFEVIPPPGGGSHYTFKRGQTKLTVPRPRAGKVKLPYVKQALQALEEAEKL